MLDKVKLAIREDSTDLDADIQDTIDACKADMKITGILENKIVDTDMLIVRAIKLYCKSEYSTDDKESERYRMAYESLKNHLSLCKEYTEETE